MLRFEDSLRTTEDQPFFFETQCGKPNENAKWRGPGGGPSSFYTTWSFWAIIATTIFTLLIVPLLFFVPKFSNSELMSSLSLAIIIGFAVNSLAVALTSQFLLNFNWKPLDPNNRTAADENWIKKLNNINAKVHLLPIILSLFILTLIIKAPWKGNKTILYFASCLVSVIFFIVWLCVPVPVSPDNKKDKTRPWNKIAYVYNFPDAWIMGLFPVAIVFGTVLFVLAKRGNLSLLKK